MKLSHSELYLGIPEYREMGLYAGMPTGLCRTNGVEKPRQLVGGLHFAIVEDWKSWIPLL